MQKILFFFVAMMLCSASLKADPNCKFDPKQYRQALQQYITAQARLTPQEAARFFPIYDEMRAKQRVIFRSLSTYRKGKPDSEKECLRVIREHDKNEIEMKRLQQTYHSKFLKVISASKLFEVIKAEESFNRKAFKKVSGRK